MEANPQRRQHDPETASDVLEVKKRKTDVGEGSGDANMKQEGTWSSEDPHAPAGGGDGQQTGASKGEASATGNGAVAMDEQDGEKLQTTKPAWEGGFKADHLTKRERFLLLSQKLRQIFTEEGNARDTLSEAITSSHCGLDIRYEVRVSEESGKTWAVGRLHLGDLLIAGSSGECKMQVETETYKRAIVSLASKPIGQLLEGVTEEEAEVDYENPGQKQDKEGFLKLVAYLKSEESQAGSDPVAELTTALSKSKCGLSCKNEERELKKFTGWFSGKVLLNKILIAAGCNIGRKLTKAMAYTRALKTLRTRPVFVLMYGYSIEALRSEQKAALSRTGKEKITPVDITGSVQCHDTRPPPLMKALEPRFDLVRIPPNYTHLPGRDTQQHLAGLIDDVFEIKERGSLIFLNLNKAIRENHIVPTYIFRQADMADENSEIVCEVYMDNILMAVGKGGCFPESLQKAYVIASEILLTSSADEIFSDFDQINIPSLNSDDLLEVWWGGTSPQGESNIGELIRKIGLYFQVEHEPPSKVEDMILIEQPVQAETRSSCAFSILKSSCTKNRILMQWAFEEAVPLANTNRNWRNKNDYVCEVWVQGKKVGKGTGYTQKAAQNAAAAQYLFELYQTNTTVQQAPHTLDVDSELSIKQLYVLQKAAELKAASGETGSDEDDLISVGSAEVKDKDQDPEQEDDQQQEQGAKRELMVSKWVKQVIEDLISDFTKQETLNEMLFCWMFSEAEEKVIWDTVEANGLKCNKWTAYRAFQNLGPHLFRLFKCYTPKEFVDILERHGGQRGFFKIIPKSQLPSVDDL